MKKYVYYNKNPFEDMLAGIIIPAGRITCVSDEKLDSPDSYICVDFNGDSDDYMVVGEELIKLSEEKKLELFPFLVQPHVRPSYEELAQMLEKTNKELSDVRSEMEKIKNNWKELLQYVVKS